jgi:WD40 repeat protein
MQKSLEFHIANVDGACSFDFVDAHSPSILVVGCDMFLKRIDYNLNNKTFETEIPDEGYAIAVNPTNPAMIAYGGASHNVDVITDLNVSNAVSVMKFYGSVYQVEWDRTGRFIAAASDDSCAVIFDIKEERSYKCEPGHEGSVLSAHFDALNRFIATVGCDGHVNIYTFATQTGDIQINLVKRHRIGKETQVKNPQRLRPSWHPEEPCLALPGGKLLNLLKQSPKGEWEHLFESQFRHDADITQALWLEVSGVGLHLATAGLDHLVRVWFFATKEMKAEVKVNDFVQEMRYQPASNALAIVDYTGHYAIWGNVISQEVERKTGLGSKHRVVKFEEEDSAADLVTTAMKPVAVIQEAQFAHIPQQVHDSKRSLAMEEEPQRQIQQEIQAKSTRMDENSNSKTFDMVKGVKKPNVPRQISRADEIIDAYPQNVLHPSSTSSFFDGRRLLSWNLLGAISLRNEGERMAIDIEFDDKTYHPTIVLTDFAGISMGTMNHRGAVMASRFKEQNDNEYEDEEDESQKHSTLRFKSFHGNLSEFDWEKRLEEGENAEAVAIGSNWCALATSYLNLRIFNHQGLELAVYALERLVVALAGYENILAIVLHEGVPLLGCQALKVRLIDAEVGKMLCELPLPISPGATLTWFGFSEEGMLLSYDTEGVLRGCEFTYTRLWTNLFEQSAICKQNHQCTSTSKLWFVGMCDYEIVGVILSKDAVEPTKYPRPHVTSFAISPPFLPPTAQQSTMVQKFREQIVRKRIILSNEISRAKLFMHQKTGARAYSTNKFDKAYNYKNMSIKGAEEVLKADEVVDKHLVDIFREALVAEDNEMALSVIPLFHSGKVARLCAVLAEKLNRPVVAEKAKLMIQTTEFRNPYEEVSATPVDTQYSMIPQQSFQGVSSLYEDTTRARAKKMFENSGSMISQSQNEMEIAPPPKSSNRIVDEFKEVFGHDRTDRHVNPPASTTIHQEEPHHDIPSSKPAYMNPFSQKANSKAPEKSSIFEAFRPEESAKRSPVQFSHRAFS